VTGAKSGGSIDYQKIIDDLRKAEPYDAQAVIAAKRKAREAGYKFN